MMMMTMTMMMMMMMMMMMAYQQIPTHHIPTSLFAHEVDFDWNLWADLDFYEWMNEFIDATFPQEIS